MQQKPKAQRTTVDALPARQRSRVTNRKGLFVEGDQRSAWSRRFRDLVDMHVADLGGVEHLSESQKSLIRRVATIECELERQEGVLAAGGEIDLSKYATASNSLRRILETLGLRRVAKDVTPSLADIIKRSG